MGYLWASTGLQALEALARLLIRKTVISLAELLKELDRLKATQT